MADIIKLKPKDSPVFRELFCESVDRLQAAADVLLEDAVNLAMHGPWREWNEQQPVGAASMLEPAELADCGDARLAKLYAMYCSMAELIQELRPDDTSAGDSR